MYQFKVNASDQNGDAISFSVNDSISSIANVTGIGNNEALVSVAPTTLDAFDLKIIVKVSLSGFVKRNFTACLFHVLVIFKAVVSR